MPFAPRRLLSLEFFPRGPRKASKSWRRRGPVRAVEARLLLGHVRRRRLDARRHARDGAGVSRRRHPKRRRTSPASAARGSAAGVLIEYRSHGIRHLVALRGDLPSGAAPPAISATRAIWSRSIRRKRATGSTSTSRRIRIPPQAATRRKTSGLQAQDRGRRHSADHAVFLQRGRVLHFVRGLRRRRIDVRSFPASCRSGASRSWPAFRRLRRRDPALDQEEARSFGDDTGSIRAFGLDVVTELCDGCSRAALPAAFLHVEPGGADDDDLAALGL